MNELFEVLKKIALLIFGPYLMKAKTRGAICYMEGVETARRLVVAGCIVVICLIVLSFSLILIPVALCEFMPWTSTVKAWVALLFGVVYVLGALMTLAFLLSEKRWMKLSRAREYLEKVTMK